MVNLRKIGAIATGALFVGATIGMAAAITVPTAFQSSMLAQNGVAKAKLVVGNKAGGIEADRASATIIKDTAATKLAVTAVGGQVAFKYGVNDLNDDNSEGLVKANFSLAGGTCTNFDLSDGNHTTKSRLDSTGQAGCLLAINQSLWFDGNGDGDLSDSDDYMLYNGLYVIDGDGGLFAPVLWGPMPIAGDLRKVKGTDYLITKTENNNQTLSMGAAIKKTLVSLTALDAANAVTIVGTKKMQYVNTTTGQKTLYVMDGNDVQYGLPLATLGTAYEEKTTDITDNSDVFDAYKIFLSMSADRSQVNVRMAESTNVVKVSDGQENVMGYAKLHSNDGTFAGGAGAGAMVLQASPVSIPKDDSVSLADTYYTMKFSIEKKLDLVRDKSVSVNSGTKLKNTISDYEPIVDDTTSDFTVSAVGGQVAFKYGVNDLNDDNANDAAATKANFSLAGGTCTNFDLADGNHTTKSRLDSTGLAGCLLATNQSMWFDGNGDGDVSDSDDYMLYNGVYVIDGDGGLFAPVFWGPMPIAGSLMKVKGTDYLITKTENNNQTLNMGAAIKKTLVGVSAIDAANAVTIVGTKKMQLVVSATGAETLYVMDGTDVQFGLDVSSVTTTTAYEEKTTDITDNSDVFDAYKIFLGERVDNTSIKVRLTESTNVVKVSDGQENVMGYAKLHSNDGEYAGGAGAGTVVLEASPVSIPKDDSVSLADTYYTMKFSIDKKLDLVRDKSVSVNSGTKLKNTISDYEPIVDDTTSDFTVSVTGGAVVTPSLAIAEDDAVTTADKNDFNLVLVGGPVANALTASLVQTRAADAGSLDSWKASDGDIKVVANAFATGKYGIIVAGKNREATAAAAKALADAL